MLNLGLKEEEARGGGDMRLKDQLSRGISRRGRVTEEVLE
jgi:hypothetical protein